MKQQVHSAYAQHRLVSIIAIDHAGLDVGNILTGIEGFTIVLLDIFHSLYKETSTTHSWVADIILWSWIHHFDNHADDMARSTELTIGT